MSKEDRATIAVLEEQLNRAIGRWEMHRTLILEARILRLKEAIAFIKGE